MKVTTQDLLQVIKEISSKIDLLQNELVSKENKINDLQAKNDELLDNNHSTLSQIEEYIKELEVIRNHYVANKN